ncbi:hypothetical protein [Streptomyces sp. PT12]|uniref:DUF2201 family putative metallopeptidase n=1 Tax=Streptomyces sp. PT12 TaxID=1510197 RepID=UPI000DE1B9A8|nr:hypothetical protein [Streptomyces sp. PT12]RBM19467.1 hypothetical protein DEH69_10915 [Streptomyces sp. PT12]
MSRGRRRAAPDPNLEAFTAAWRTLGQHPLFRPMMSLRAGGFARGGARAELVAVGRLGSARAIARVSAFGQIRASRGHRLGVDAWTWVLAHCLLHLGFGHAAGARAWDDPVDRAVACVAVARFQRALKLGGEPLPLPAELPSGDEEALRRRWRDNGVPPELADCGTGGLGPDLEPRGRRDGEREGRRDGPHLPDWSGAFAVGLAASATAAVDVAGGARLSLTDPGAPRPPWELALGWFLSSSPLLGALAARFTLVADAELARGWDISIAAVSPSAAEIYVNPLRRLPVEQWRFVLAHEMLHAALRHGDRVGARDPYLWNVAADHVVNGWLVEMAVGEMPEGALYDPRLAGLSADEVYDRIVDDARRARRLATLRGTGVGDVLGEPLPWTGRKPGYGVDLDAYYRREAVAPTHSRGNDASRSTERGAFAAGRSALTTGVPLTDRHSSRSAIPPQGAQTIMAFTCHAARRRTATSSKEHRGKTALPMIYYCLTAGALAYVLAHGVGLNAGTLGLALVLAALAAAAALAWRRRPAPGSASAGPTSTPAP